jgi:uncharacterized protein YndB with AHSA1/START domain
MGGNCVFQEEEHAKPNIVRSVGVATAASVHVKVQIHADAQRLFLALTEPEFVDLWLTPPEAHTSPTSIVSRNGGDLHICFLHQGFKSEEAVWKYVVRRRRKIRFWWIRNDESGGSETLVTIRLRGNFGCTIVALTHSGIAGTQDCDLYRNLWTGSLSKLSSLLNLSKGGLKEKGSVIGH